MQISAVNQNINFKSDIKFVNETEFEEIAEHAQVRAPEMWSIYDVKEFSKDAATKNIRYCLGGVYKTQGKNHIFHFYPGYIYYDEDKTSIQELEEAVRELGEVKGLVIGGLTGCPQADWQGLKLFNALKKNLKNNDKADFTVFYGQKKDEKAALGPSSNLYYSVAADTYFINAKKSWGAISNAQELKDNFEVISISDNDKVYIDGKLVSNEFLNKNDTNSIRKRVCSN